MCAYMPRSRGIFLRKMPPSAGIYLHICPHMRAYMYIYATGCTYISPGFGAISNSIARKCGNSFFFWALLQGYFGPKNRLCIYTPKKDIQRYIQYLYPFWRAIYNDIAPTARFFFVRGKKIPRARPCPRDFFCRGRKKPRWRRVYCCIQPDENNIYNKYATFSTAAGIYTYICPQLRAYIHIYARSCGHIYIYMPAAAGIYTL